MGPVDDIVCWMWMPCFVVEESARHEPKKFIHTIFLYLHTYSKECRESKPMKTYLNHDGMRDTSLAPFRRTFYSLSFSFDHTRPPRQRSLVDRRWRNLQKAVERRPESWHHGLSLQHQAIHSSSQDTGHTTQTHNVNLFLLPALPAQHPTLHIDTASPVVYFLDS